jgi:Holliday junction resolvase-like predicted endonuclease
MLITEFHKYMEIGGASERHQNNGLKMVIAFALSIGKDVTLYDIKSNEPDKVQSPYVYTLDVKLEDFVEKVLLKQGYTSTQTRQKLEGLSHALNEIDIVGHKTDRLTAVECKNYSEARTVGIKEIRDFQSKLQDLPQIHDAIFVTNARFSSEAEIYSAHHNISLWDGEKLSRIHYLMNMGRFEKTSGDI